MADNMMRVAGRNPSGNAMALRVDASGYAQMVQEGFSKDLVDTYCFGKAGISPVAAGTYLFYLSTSTNGQITGDSHTQIPNFATQLTNVLYRRWKITVMNGTAKSCVMSIYPFSPISTSAGLPNGQFTSSFKLAELTLTATGVTNRRIITSLDGGEGKSSILSVPELDGMHRDFAFGFVLAEAPASGKIIIGVEAQK